MKSSIRTTLFSLAILIQMPAYAEDNHHNEAKTESPGVEALSPELRELLTKEMLALQNGMTDIIPAYISGDWSTIENIAHKMKHSYILKQRLTSEQIEELHSSLPNSFIKLDQQFHYLAGMLEHVAQKKKVELVGFYFSKLSEACVSCHTQYATHKFPAFAPAEQNNGHSH